MLQGVRGDEVVPVAIAALALAVIHLWAPHVTFSDGIPRRDVLSLAAGVSVAYVFVHVLPEIGRANRTIEIDVSQTALDVSPTVASTPVALAENHAYLITLVGFVGYYGLERLVRCSQNASGDDAPSPGVFGLHLGSFAVYNGLIGFLLVHREGGTGSLWLFALALGLHLLVTDFSLRDRYPDRYHDRGRWLLSLALLLGTGIGLATGPYPTLTDVLFAFLGGGIVLNVVKEELPAERQSRFWAFALGTGVYAVLLTAV